MEAAAPSLNRTAWLRGTKCDQESTCWAGQKVHLKINTSFIFTNDFIDLDILSSQLSPLATGCQWVEARGAAKHLPMHKKDSEQRTICP